MVSPGVRSQIGAGTRERTEDVMLEAKFKRPVKEGNTWPGLTNVLYIKPPVQYPWRFHCPQPLCFYVVHAPSEATAIKRINEHPCPWYGGGTTTFSWGVMSDDYLTPIWGQLDDQVDIIKGTIEVHHDVFVAARHKARAVADVLAVLMPPFFTDGDEIVREALVRWEKRQAGQEYETPGLGRFKFKRPPGVIGNPDYPSWAPSAEHDPDEEKPAPKHELSDDAIAKIKASKGFPVTMLAMAYGTTDAVIKYIQAS